MVNDVGHNFAKRWSDAHEEGDPNNTTLRKTMDLHNNAVGLRLGRSYPNAIWHGCFIEKSMDRVDKGRCLRIVNGILINSDRSGKK